MKKDLQDVLTQRNGKYSDRNLGNPSNMADWTPQKLNSLYTGIQTARQFFPQMPPTDLARMILSEGGQESTGNPNQGAGTDSVGFLQVTPGTVVQDFRDHGTAIKGPNGQTIVDPKGTIDPTDPATNVALWAWYTHNAVTTGESDNEYAMGHQGTDVVKDFGNAQFDWLGGPHNDRHNASQASGYSDYHSRIEDYFVQSGFGSAQDFNDLLNTAVTGGVMDLKK